MIRFLRVFIVHTVLVALAGGTVSAAPASGASAQDITQREFAVMLVSAFHWDKGLPEKPGDKDYLAILGGRRSYYFEAEDAYSKKTDNAVVKNYELFGPFSGSGWVSGVAVPTTVSFKLFLPLEGNYTLSVASKGDGQIWSAGGQKLKVSTGKRFRQEVVGTVYLKAGEQEISVDLPAEGAIDFFAIEAPLLAAIEPLQGWQFDAPLTLGAVAEITSSLLSWEKEMPEDAKQKPVRIDVADAASIPSGAKTTTIGYLGDFEAAKWVRAGRAGSVRIVVPLILAETAPYHLKVRFLGEMLSAELDGMKMEKEGKPYLDWVDLGVHRLKVGAHTLILKLPPNGGVDVVTLSKLKSTKVDYMKLAGIDGNPDEHVSKERADRFLTQFVERFKERR